MADKAVNIAKFFILLYGGLGGFVLLFNVLEPSELVGVGIVLGVFVCLSIWIYRSRRLDVVTKGLLGTYAGVLCIASLLWFTEVLLDELDAPDWAKPISILCYLVVALILIIRSKQMNETLQTCLGMTVFALIVYGVIFGLFQS